MPLTPGDQLGPYEIQSPLGEGGMGQVWKARDTRLNRTVAIKISHEQYSERFAREARAIAALNHPHICTLFDVGPDYLVMEYVEGKPLRGTSSFRGRARVCGAMR
jgi:serine/threonine protein kinase